MASIDDHQMKPEKKVIENPPSLNLQDVQYGISNSVPLLMNIKLPNPMPSKPVPLIVFLHGGGWSGGSRNDMMSRCDLVSKQGYAGASVEYRLSGIAPFPAQLQDCKCAIRYLRANAAKYHIDPNRIAVWGCSAGGHLAAMIGLTEGISEFDSDGGYNDTPSDVQMVINCFGPTDFTAWEETVNKFAFDENARKLFAPPADEPMMWWWSNFSLEKDPGIVKMFEGKARERADWASPITYANRDSMIKDISNAEKWQDISAYREKIKSANHRWSMLDTNDTADWKRPELITDGMKLSSEPSDISGNRIKYEAKEIRGWGMFIKEIPKNIFKNGKNAIAFWAKGDENTPEIFIEMNESNGSRWMHNLKITTDWKYYEIPLDHFSWFGETIDRKNTGRMKINPESAAKFAFGLASLNTILKPGAHQIWIDGLSSTKTAIPTLPMFLLVHGTQDTWVPIQQSLTFADALDKIGADTTLLIKPNMGHDESKAWPEIMDYIKKVWPVNKH